MGNADIKNVSLTVIGKTTAGKTTWILSLLREDICVKLQEITKKNEPNKDGQTKCVTEYMLCAPDSDVYLNYIELNICDDEIDLENDYKDFYNIIMDYINQGIAPKKENGYWRVHLKKDKDLKDVYDNLINNYDLQKMDIIKKISINVPAHPDVWDAITYNGLEQVTIFDTRGIGDDKKALEEYLKKGYTTDKQGKKAEEDEESAMMQFMIDRAYIDADGCLFLSKGPMGLEGDVGKMYAPLFAEIAKNMPTFIVARCGALADKIRSHHDKRNWYLKQMDRDNIDDTGCFKGELEYAYEHMEIRNLLAKYGYFDGASNDSELRRKHYRQLLLPIVINENEVDKDNYNCIARIVFIICLEELLQYKKDIKEAEDKHKEFIRYLYMKAFMNDFLHSIKLVNVENYVQYDSNWLKKTYLGDIADKLSQTDYKDARNMKGSCLLGPNGGITPINEHMHAIDLLKSSITEFRKLMNVTIDECKEHEDISYLNVAEYLNERIRKNLDQRSTTPYMFNKDMIEKAHGKVQSSLAKDVYSSNENELINKLHEDNESLDDDPQFSLSKMWDAYKAILEEVFDEN